MMYAMMLTCWMIDGGYGADIKWYWYDAIDQLTSKQISRLAGMIAHDVLFI